MSQSTFYKHCNEGRLKPGADGVYTLKAIQKYARVHLMQLKTGQKIEDEILQRDKTSAEIEKLKEQAKLAKIKRMAEEGRYVLRESFDLELAGRAAVLETGLKGMVQARAGEFVAMVDGDEKKTGDLARDMMAAIDQALNEFATTREFQVIFENRGLE